MTKTVECIFFCHREKIMGDFLLVQQSLERLYDLFAEHDKAVSKELNLKKQIKQIELVLHYFDCFISIESPSLDKKQLSEKLALLKTIDYRRQINDFPTNLLAIRKEFYKGLLSDGVHDQRSKSRAYVLFDNFSKLIFQSIKQRLLNKNAVMIKVSQKLRDLLLSSESPHGISGYDPSPSVLDGEDDNKDTEAESLPEQDLSGSHFQSIATSILFKRKRAVEKSIEKDSVTLEMT